MSLFDEAFWSRVEMAVRKLDERPELAAAIQSEVDAFFAKHPAILRTRTAEAFISSLVIERLSAPADSQSAPTQTQKVA